MDSIGMTQRQNEIWQGCEEYWYISILYNSWANEQNVRVMKRKIDKQDLDQFLIWCKQHGDNMYCSKEEAEKRREELLKAFK